MTLKKTALLFVAAMMYALPAISQSTQGPTIMPQLNSDFYVGSVVGFYPTIQNAITLRCAASGLGSRVIIPAGSPADGTSGFTISTVTGGCVKVSIEDRRAVPVGAYLWNTTGTPAYQLQGSGGGGNPFAGTAQDNQFNAGSGVPGADTGIYQYNSTTHTLIARNILPDAVSFFTGQGNTIQRGKNNDTPTAICGGTPCTSSSIQGYVQSVRAPSGGTNVIPRSLDVEIQGGFENENNPGSPEFEAERLTYHVQSSGQTGGVYAHFLEQDAPGDFVYKTLLMQCVGGNRSQDENCEYRREFIGFLNPNFGGHGVKGTTFSTGDQPVQITPFGGYTTKSPGIDMLLVDATKRVSAGNVINTTSVDSGWLVQVTLDTPHSLGVSTKTTLTAAVDANIYTGSCPSVTNTGVLYPSAGPYAHSGDAFSTLENGTGLGTINANYRNDTTNTLIGYCLRFATVGTAPAAGTIMHIADQQATSEFVTVIASGTTWATAFVHHQHPVGAIVTWGGGVGQGFGMAADEIAPGSISAGYNFFGEGPQTSISKLVYPVAYTPDSTHVVFDTGAETAGAEWRTRGFPSVTPSVPMTVALTQSGGIVNSASPSVNDYSTSPQFSGTSAELPPPAYTVAGCTVPPVLKFTWARATGLSYTVSVVSGGSGCSGTPTVTLLPPANPAYFAPVAWIRSVVDTANCSALYPFNCSSTDGYILADSGAKNFTNGDEILEGLRSFRYLTDQHNEMGDAIVANSGRNGQTHINTHGWVQSGSPYDAEVDLTPSEFIYGSFTNGWTADPTIPRSASLNPGPIVEIAGVQNTELDMLPPTVGGNLPGAFQGLLDDPSQLNMGTYKFTFDCILHPEQAGILDHPCLHGQYFPYGLAFNKIGPFPSGIYVNPSDGSWRVTRDFWAKGALKGSMLTLLPSFPNVSNPSSLGLQNSNKYTVFSKSQVVSTVAGDSQLSAQEYTGSLVHVGANDWGPGAFPSWTGSIGSTTRTYTITATTPEGETTGVGSQATIANGPALLDSVTNFITLKGVYNGGAQGGNVYRTSGPGGIGFVCSFTNGPGLPECADTGQAANASLQPPTVDTSGSFVVNGSQKMKSIHGNATQLQAQSGPSTLDHVVTYDAAGNIHDSTVNINALGGGGLTGQTINSIPLATSPTGSTTSSNLSQSADGSTLTFTSPLPGCMSLNPTQICLTDTTYNASWQGGTTTTTSATFSVGTSGSVASCSTFRTNQGVLITGAGASGANYIGKVVTCTGTTLTVTPSTSTSVASGVVVQHDETAAFLAAISALPNGGTIQLPLGTSTSAIYLVNGPLLDTGCANAVLPMLKLANYVGNPITVTIRGLDTPGGTAAQAGEIIQTSTPSGNLFGGCDSVAGGGFPPFTNVKLNLENLTLSSYTNPGVVMVNATALQGFIGKHLYVNMPSVSLPTNTAGGAIWLPAVANNVQISLDDVNSAGYYTLYKIGEHAHLGAVYGSFGVNCFQFDNGTSPSGTFVGNSASVDYLWDAHCTNAITGPSVNPMTVNVLVADLETATTEEVNDPSSLLHGIINFTIPQNNGAPINCTPRVVGGANLTLHPLQCQPEAALPPGPPAGMIENWKSQDGSGATLANTGSDSTNSMTTTNVTWATAAGFTGLVATYNGSTSTATAATDTNTNFTGSTPFSICQWVNPSTLAGFNSELLLANTNATTGIAVELQGALQTPVGAYQVFLYSSLTNYIEVSTTSAATIPVGSATLACFTYAATGVASGVTMYLNGVPVAATVVSDTLSGSIASGLPMRIGSGGGPAFAGAIGRVRIFNRLLSSAEISAMFAAGTTAY